MTTPPAWSAEQLREAAEALRAVTRPTPLVAAPALAERVGVPVYLKCEQFQPIGAFKVRGAFTALARLPDPVRERGVVTHSSGNHGQAVAFAAARFGVRALIVMPQTASPVKVEGVRRHGGSIEFVPPVSTARAERAEALAREHGMTLLPPYDHPDVILGQATCGLEILDQAAGLRTILAPVGGGGLLAGTCVAVTALHARTEVIGVEPAGAPKLSRALQAGHPVVLDRAESVADGLLPLSVGRLTFTYIAPVVRRTAAVTDGDIGEAMRALYREAGLRVEPSGAASVAALLAGHVRPDGPVVAILSGGNVAPDVFDRLVFA